MAKSISKAIGRRPYLVGLVSINRPGEYPPPPYLGRGWNIDAVTHSYTETLDRRGQRKSSHNELEYGQSYASNLARTERVDDRTIRLYTQPIIVVWAPNRIIAQGVANLIAAASSVLNGYLFLEDILAIPKKADDREDLDELTYISRRNNCFAAPGFAQAAALAAKCSRRARLTYALIKLWSSFRSCSRDWMDFHPDYGQAFGVTRSPVDHIIFSQAIVSAYSAIEEPGLSVGTGIQAYDAGRFLPEVQKNLDIRLKAAGIDPSHSFIWTVRGTKTRLEKNLPMPRSTKTSWTKNTIRDRYISLAEAIARARWLRSKASAHESSNLTRSLTWVDVHNVQMIARRLLLELLGFLPGNNRRPSL